MTLTRIANTMPAKASLPNLTSSRSELGSRRHSKNARSPIECLIHLGRIARSPPQSTSAPLKAGVFCILGVI